MAEEEKGSEPTFSERMDGLKYGRKVQARVERIKLNAFLVFTAVYVAIVYPIAGSWKWGAGFLDDRGFYDFAGSTLVHSVGGWAALIGVIVLCAAGH